VHLAAWNPVTGAQADNETPRRAARIGGAVAGGGRGLTYPLAVDEAMLCPGVLKEGWALGALTNMLGAAPRARDTRISDTRVRWRPAGTCASDVKWVRRLHGITGTAPP
jgi:hypothetical protein